MNKRQSTGFTLIELMVTIAVLAVIAMMAAPSFGDMMSKQNLNRSTQDLVAAVKDARARAVLERKDVTAKEGAIPTPPDGKIYWQLSGTTVLKSGSPTEITFNLNGAVNGATADTDFTICDKSGGAKSKTVSISPMGTLQMIKDGTC